MYVLCECRKLALNTGYYEKSNFFRYWSSNFKDLYNFIDSLRIYLNSNKHVDKVW